MEIKGKVHLFFEQSGTFRDQFRKLGFDAFDYDIQDNFGKTDYKTDLFAEIDKAYNNLRTEQNRTEQNRTEQTIFDTIDPCQDLIIAFYPCIYFCAMSQMAFYLTYRNYQKLSTEQKYRGFLNDLTTERSIMIDLSSLWPFV